MIYGAVGKIGSVTPDFFDLALPIFRLTYQSK